jgi:hypothetical protein
MHNKAILRISVFCHLLCKETHKSRHQTTTANGGVKLFEMLTMILKLFVIVCALTAVGCSNENNVFSSTRSQTIESAEGHQAYIVEGHYGKGDSNTQVIVMFNGGKCGSGVAAGIGVDLGLSISWVGLDQLHINNPKNAVLTRNANGEIIQCLNKKITVKIITKNVHEPA